MNCSDQRNASLITPICAWPYIYITFQRSLSEGLKNLGQNGGKCKKGQEVSSRSWTLNEELSEFYGGADYSLCNNNQKMSTRQIRVSCVFNQRVLFESLSSTDKKQKDEEK